VVIAFATKGLRGEQSWKETWEPINTPSKGVKRDTNLKSLPDSPLLDNPYRLTASLE